MKMKCPYCKSKDTFVYHKTKQPNITSACSKEMLKQVKIYPFEARLCNNCLLGFASVHLDSEGLKSIYDNYVFISPMRGIGVSGSVGILQLLEKYYSKDEKVVEIGCSEGYLLNELKKKGYKNLIGIEPGPQADDAKKAGLTVLKTYFDEHTFQGKKVDGFILKHVFEHFEDPFSILDAMKKQLSAKGKIIIEVPDFFDFSSYFHEHLFYYNLAFFIRLCKDKNLKIIDADTSSPALRVVIAHKDNAQYPEIDFSESPQIIIDKVKTHKSAYLKKLNQINQLLKDSKEVYWWGAGTLSVMLLNEIDSQLIEKIKMVIDGDKRKKGYFIPGVNLKINFYESLKGKELGFLIINSEFDKEIMNTLKKNNISVKKIEVFYD